MDAKGGKINLRDTRILWTGYADAPPGTKPANLYKVVELDARRALFGKTMFGPASWKDCVAWRREHLEVA